MELINQHTKGIMEECKVRARDAGLVFGDETLEYIVTNKDLLELSPKHMIPTLYDYWVNDVEMLKGKGMYKLYPSNPYETVINSRPAISFYNDNNPDWLNIMIFYHVLAHIDFFQNNRLFRNTWGDDFVGQALADKRMITKLRSEHGRWTDYVIEFSRGLNNLTGYFESLAVKDFPDEMNYSSKLKFFFEDFLQEIKQVPDFEVFKEIQKYNQFDGMDENLTEKSFFAEVKKKYPEFNAIYKKRKLPNGDMPQSVLAFIHENSPSIRKEKNLWMRSVIDVVMNTALYFEPQIRTKIVNEGWASYWHDKLFRSDERIRGHEVAYAKTNALVTSLSRVGLNPYAVGLRLIEHVEDLINKGKLGFDFRQVHGIIEREEYNKNTGKGREGIFKLRENFSDFMLVNTFIDQDFVNQHNLFVAGNRLNTDRNVEEYYVKSRDAADYKKMVIDSLYDPPDIQVVPDKSGDDNLYLRHTFEGKQLVKDFIGDTMMGTEFLWGGQVQLETTEIVRKKGNSETEIDQYEEVPVIYTMKDRKLSKQVV